MKNDSLQILKTFSRKLVNSRFRVAPKTLIEQLKAGEFGYTVTENAEPVAVNDFVLVDDFTTLIDHIKVIFNEPLKFLKKEDVIKHVARFISNLWQIHIFGEGNTRTTAIFLIKYLSKLGFNVTNDIFAENSWYFRNALVRANYNNREKGITETTYYVELFLRNLLLGEDNILSNREMHVAYKEPVEPAPIVNDRENAIIEILRANPSITLDEVAEKIGKSPRTAKNAVKSMQERGILERMGGKKNGSWKTKLQS